MVRVGFTGTRVGMTSTQKERFAELIKSLKPNIFTHGDCIGADAEAHDIVKKILPGCSIRILPCVLSAQRAFKKGDSIEPEKHPLVRNRDIVNSSDYIIAAVAGRQKMRSGTWSTVRYAEARNVNNSIIFPEGHVTRNIHERLIGGAR